MLVRKVYVMIKIISSYTGICKASGISIVFVLGKVQETIATKDTMVDEKKNEKRNIDS